MNPQFGGVHHLQAQAFTGLDAFVLPLLPREVRLRVVARKILRHHGFISMNRVFMFLGGIRIEPVPAGAFTFSLPGESLPYEVMNTAGRVQAYVRKE